MNDTIDNVTNNCMRMNRREISDMHMWIHECGPVLLDCHGKRRKSLKNLEVFTKREQTDSPESTKDADDK